MKRFALVILLVSLISFVSANADDGNEYGMMDEMYHMMSGSWGYSGMFFGWFVTLLVIVVWVLLIIWLIKQIQKR